MTKLVKRLDLKEAYPKNAVNVQDMRVGPNYQDLLTEMMKKTTLLFDLCNSDTVHLPIDCLTKLAQIDQDSSLRVGGLVVPCLVQLYEAYHQDGMLEGEVIGLIKVWAGFRENYEFKKTFLPAIERTVTEYHQALKNASPESQLRSQTMADEGVVKNMLQILNAYLLANGSAPDLRPFFQQLIDQLLEILDCCQDIYTRVHATRVLATLSGIATPLFILRKEATLKVLQKLLSPSFDQSSSVFVGQLLISFAEAGLIQAADLQSVIVELLSEKFAAASSPSVLKGYALAVCYFMHQAPDRQLAIFSQADPAQKVLDAWTTYQPVFAGTLAKCSTYLGLLKVFNLCLEVAQELG